MNQEATLMNYAKILANAIYDPETAYEALCNITPDNTLTATIIEQGKEIVRKQITTRKILEESQQTAIGVFEKYLKKGIENSPHFICEEYHVNSIPGFLLSPDLASRIIHEYIVDGCHFRVDVPDPITWLPANLPYTYSVEIEGDTDLPVELVNDTMGFVTSRRWLFLRNYQIPSTLNSKNTFYHLWAALQCINVRNNILLVGLNHVLPLGQNHVLPPLTPDEVRAIKEDFKNKVYLRDFEYLDKTMSGESFDSISLLKRVFQYVENYESYTKDACRFVKSLRNGDFDMSNSKLVATELDDISFIQEYNQNNYSPRITQAHVYHLDIYMPGIKAVELHFSYQPGIFYSDYSIVLFFSPIEKDGELYFNPEFRPFFRSSGFLMMDDDNGYPLALKPLDDLALKYDAEDNAKKLALINQYTPEDRKN